MSKNSVGLVFFVYPGCGASQPASATHPASNVSIQEVHTFSIDKSVPKERRIFFTEVHGEHGDHGGESGGLPLTREFLMLSCYREAWEIILVTFQ